MPITAWTPVPETAVEIAAERSPSLMSWIRAPAARTSAISASWRGRSRITTVMSATFRPSAAAIRCRFSVGLSRMSTLPAATGPTHSFSRYVSGAWIRPPFSEAARTVIAPAWPWATRFVPSSGSTAMSISGLSSTPGGVRGRPGPPIQSIGASRASPSPMTIVPANSISSMVERIASTAARSASSFSPRPMNRADASAAASVTRTISSARSCSIRSASSVPEMPCAREHHGHVVPVGDLDRHLVADRSARLDDRGHPGLGGELDPVGEREVGVARHDRGLGPVAGPPQRDLDRGLAAGLSGPDPDRRAAPGEDDRIRAHMAHGPPGEEQVVELVERGAALRHDLEPAAIEPDIVEALDEEPAGDPLEVQVGDPVVAHPLGRVG